MRYVFPIAPSTNNLYANSKGGGRHDTPEYTAWKHHAGTVCNIQRSQFKAMHIVMPIVEMAVVVVYLPFLATSDLDNRFKATLDLLVSHEIIKTDRMTCLVNIQAAIDMTLAQDTMAVLVANAQDLAAGEHTPSLELMEAQGHG